MDGAGNDCITGDTTSADFPTARALQPTFGGGGFDAFVAKIDAAGSSLVFSTFLGGSIDDFGYGIAADGAENAYVTGVTDSLDFPTLGGIRATGMGDLDGFVAKLSACVQAPGRVSGLVITRQLPSDLVLSWDPEALSAGGYHVYSVSDKVSIPTANASGNPDCAAPPGRTDCIETGALPPPPDLLFIQVVGVCADGVTEGAI